MSHLTDRIEQEISRIAGLAIIAEEDGKQILLSGMVTTEGERDTAIEIATNLSGGRPIEDNIDVTGALARQYGSEMLSEAEIGAIPGATPGLQKDGPLSAVDFMDQQTLVDPTAASGPSSRHADDDVSEGSYVFTPPVDPVGTNTEIIGGFQSDSMEHMEVERSALDNEYGDEAIADAIIRELREDSATTALDIEVEVRERVAFLRGRVPMLDDAENAEAVASHVPGVDEVREELEVAAFDEPAKDEGY